jgi:hypothetical protein
MRKKVAAQMETITCFDCEVIIEGGDPIQVQVEAKQAGWAMVQRRGPNGWSRFWVCSNDPGKKLSELMW